MKLEIGFEGMSTIGTANFVQGLEAADSSYGKGHQGIVDLRDVDLPSDAGIGLDDLQPWEAAQSHGLPHNGESCRNHCLQHFPWCFNATIFARLSLNAERDTARQCYLHLQRRKESRNVSLKQRDKRRNTALPCKSKALAMR